MVIHRIWHWMYLGGLEAAGLTMCGLFHIEGIVPLDTPMCIGCERKAGMS